MLPRGATRGATGVTDLPPKAENMELVGKLELNGRFGDVVDGQIADVAVFGNTAYLNSWDEESCTRGGVYVVDITDPAHPVETGFLPSPAGYYSGEGAHVISVATPQFTGDVLAVNLEACSGPSGPDSTTGGFSLYDVTDPANPQPLAIQSGDRSPDGSLEQSTDPAVLPNSYHSVFMWQDGPRAYLVGVDNVELADVDIYDITDPAAPELINDLDLYSAFPDIYDADTPTLNDEIFNHDMVVKKIGDRQVMLVNYWDAGYVQIDVSDPENVTYIADSDFAGPDLLGFEPQEGNGHQSEFSHDDAFVLAADEDFAPFRIDTLTISDGPNAGDVAASAIGGGAPPSVLDDDRINGPTVYAGYACDASAPIPTFASTGLTLEPGEEAIAVVQRGPGGDDNQNGEAACFPGEKAQNAVDAGYTAVVFVNRHLGSAEADVAYCGSGGYPSGAVIPSVCTKHEALHRIFDAMPPDYSSPYKPGKEPSVGDEGAKVSITGTFDGWGYARLFDRTTMNEIDAYAIPESQDPAMASGYGDLSIHEFATDPTENLAYSAYYAGGMRVVRFGPSGMEEAGAFIDDRGANFWGVEQFTQNGQRLIAGSDRDYGLYILRYTGTDAAQAPSCTARTATTTLNTPVQIPLSCTDANGDTLTLRVASAPANGTATIDGTTATYTPKPGFHGTDAFTYVANDGAADSNASPVTITVQTPAQSGTPPQPVVPGPGVGAASSSRILGTSIGRLSKSRRSIKVKVRVGGPGRIAVRLRARIAGRNVTLGRGSRTARRATTYTVVVRLSARNARSLSRAIRRSARKRVKGAFRISFDPAGSAPATLAGRTVTLR